MHTVVEEYVEYVSNIWRICCPIYLGQRTISVDSTFIRDLRAAVLGSDKCGMSFLKALTLSPWMSLQNPPHHGVE